VELNRVAGWKPALQRGLLVRKERLEKTLGEMNGKRGENPPLPRNCKRP
jgi:hypothetical protein